MNRVLVGLVVAVAAASLVACDAAAPVLSPGGGLASLTQTLYASAATSSQISLAWVDNARNATGWSVFRSGPGSGFQIVATLAAKSTSYLDNGLTPLTQYCYFVQPFKTTTRTTTYGEASNTSCAMTLSSSPIPPSNVSALLGSWPQVTITWTDNSSNETAFRVERGPSSSGPWATLGEYAANTTQTTDYYPSPWSEQQRFYRVVAVNAIGETPSVPGWIWFLDQTMYLTAIASSATSIDLTWPDESDHEDGYELQRAGADWVWSTLAIAGANSTSYRDATVAPDVLYYYRVRPRNGTSYAYWSHVASAIASASPPQSPTALVYPYGSTAITINWGELAPSVTGLRVERSMDGGVSWATFVTVDRYQYSIVDAERTPEERACYRAIAINTAGESSPSAMGCATPPAAPSNVVISDIGDGQMEVRWTDNSSVEEGYVVVTTSCLDDFCVYVDYYMDANATSVQFSASESFVDVWAIKDGGYSTSASGSMGGLPGCRVGACNAMRASVTSPPTTMPDRQIRRRPRSP
jgi:titin